MPTQQERTEASRRTIIAAALQIIGDGGYRALTPTHVEEATGTSRGLVGYHFVSKQGLTESSASTSGNGVRASTASSA